MVSLVSPMSPLSVGASLDEDEEDSELRDLVTNLLRESGTLGKMKAQLRSQVYLALEDGKEIKEPSAPSSKLSRFLSTSDGRLMLQLVSEFLAFFELKFTLSVFGPEAMEATKMVPKSRSQLIEALGLSETMAHASSAKPEAPILAEILRLSKVSVLKSETPTPTNIFRTEDESSMPSSLESATHKSSSGRFGANLKASEGSLGAGGGSRDLPQEPASFSQSNASTPLSSLTPLGASPSAAAKVTSSSSPAGPNVASVAPMPSATKTPAATSTSASEGLGGTFTVSKDKNSTFDVSRDSFGGGAKSKEDSSSSLFSKPKEESSLFSKSKPKEDALFGSPKPPVGSKHLSDLPKLGSPSSGGALGNLPPLGALGGGGSKKALAPLKKPAAGKDKDDSPKKSSDKASSPSLSSAISSLTMNTTKTAAKTLFGASSPPSADTGGKKEDTVEVVDDSVEEDLDFLSSSEKSATEEATKDETVSEVESLRADYVEKV